MNIEHTLSAKTIEALKSLYDFTVEKIGFEKTNPDFEGDLTLVVFPFLKVSKKKPEDTATEIGNYLKANVAEIASFNVVKGFLNIVIDQSFWLNYFKSVNGKPFLSTKIAENAPVVMVEYSSPNTNKPLHLGHVRNNLLGYSVAEILKAAGNKVIKTNLVNDRGIHICKSMLAWQKWGNGETPESSGLKGDHLIGKYYVEFDRKNYEYALAELKAIQPSGTGEYVTITKTYEPELNVLIDRIKKSGILDNPETTFKSILKNKELIANEKQEELIDDYFKQNNELFREVQEMLRKWEAGDKEVRTLWETMNGWVYAGFADTYNMLGVDFDCTYYESQTYLLGKDIIDLGLEKGVFKTRADKSVYIDLTADGLDEKTVLRGDGTSVYITQDIGTAVQRQQQYNFDKLIHTVGNEQDYHFKVLFLILKKLGFAWADGLHHLSYGMVELPEGKMKSREGTVVDADDLMAEMIKTAKATAEELGKAQELSETEKAELHKTVGLGALKYFMLKVDPKKKMLFNPAESIDFNGNTAPFIQFNYVRIQALLRKAKEGLHNFSDMDVFTHNVTLLQKEKELIIKLYNFNATVKQAAADYSPALIANYVYDLAKEYSAYYNDTPILKEEQKDLVLFRLQLSQTIGIAIKDALSLLGIAVPDRM